MCLGLLLLGALDDVIKTVGRAIMRDREREREKNYGPDPGEREYNNRKRERRIRLLDIQSQPVVQPHSVASL